MTSECFFKGAVCNACGEKGHIKPVCPHPGKYLKQSSKQSTVKCVDTEKDTISDTVDRVEDVNALGLHHVNFKDRNSPCMVDVSVHDVNVSMEIDTGASRSTISEEVYKEKLSNFPLSKCSLSLTSYCGQNMYLS